MLRSLWLIVVAGLAFPASILAGEIAEKSIEAAVDAGFGEMERQLIEKYYGKIPRVSDAAESEDDAKTTKDDRDSGKGGKKKGDKGLPPGLAKRDTLPPGLAKRESLPPGLAKRGLPSDLEGQLPPAPEGYERQIVEDAALGTAAVVLIHRATGVVADIVKDVVIGDDAETKDTNMDNKPKTDRRDRR